MIESVFEPDTPERQPGPGIVVDVHQACIAFLVVGEEGRLESELIGRGEPGRVVQLGPVLDGLRKLFSSL